MAIAGSTVPCVTASVKNGKPMIGASTRALKEIVYNDVEAAVAKAMQGETIYLELYADNIARFRQLVASKRGTLRFK